MTSNSPNDIIGKYSSTDFRMWSTMALKSLLSLREKSITGFFEFLAAKSQYFHCFK